MRDQEQFPGEFSSWPEEDWLNLHVTEGKDSVKLWTYRHKAVNVPQALILILHGFNGYSGHFAHIAQHLAPHGIESIAMDYRCNGRSNGKRGDFSSIDILVSDLNAFYSQSVLQYPNIPIFVLGQSLGGLLALRLSLSVKLRGLILLAPLLRVPTAAAYPSLIPKLNKLSHVFGNVPFPRNSANNGNRLQAACDATYKDSRYYRGKNKLSTINALLQGSEMMYKQIEMVETPMMIHRAGEEKLVDNGAIQELYEKSAVQDKVMHDWPEAWHDLAKDPDIYDIMDKSTQWIKDRI